MGIQNRKREKEKEKGEKKEKYVHQLDWNPTNSNFSFLHSTRQLSINYPNESGYIMLSHFTLLPERNADLSIHIPVIMYFISCCRRSQKMVTRHSYKYTWIKKERGGIVF